jgi:hypothetical protein
VTETTMTRRRGRKLAGILAGALALGLVPFAVPASAQTDELPTARNIGDFACPVDDNATPSDTSDDTTEVPEDGFTDVPAANVHEFSIDCIVWYEVARGTSATTYNPAGDIKRDQMASFIAQLIDYTATDGIGGNNALPPVPTGNQFPCDLTNANVHYNNIQRLAAADIVLGTGSSTAGACYDPSGTVTRAQMATFIKNAQDFIYGADLPLVTEDYFADDESDTHENNINIIAGESIARGTGTDANNDNVYNPGGFVKRDQMASFLANKLDVLVDAGETEPPPAVDTIVVAPTPPTANDDIAVTVTLKRGNVESIAVSGCGITGTDLNEQPFAGTNPTETAVGLTLGSATGNCDLTIVVETDEDTTITTTKTITVNP